jgi:hypothetical protein
MRYCASADVVNAILDAYPAAAMVKENCGLTPVLHMGMESVSRACPLKKSYEK